MEGWVRRRADLRQWKWNTRYLVLDTDLGLLHYFGKDSDCRPKRTYLLHNGCSVSDPVNKDGNDKEGSFWAFKLYLSKSGRDVQLPEANALETFEQDGQFERNDDGQTQPESMLSQQIQRNAKNERVIKDSELCKMVADQPADNSLQQKEKQSHPSKSTMASGESALSNAAVAAAALSTKVQEKRRPKVVRISAVLELSVASKKEADKWVRTIRNAILKAEFADAHPSQDQRRSRFLRRHGLLRGLSTVTSDFEQSNAHHEEDASSRKTNEDGIYDFDDEDDEFDDAVEYLHLSEHDRVHTIKSNSLENDIYDSDTCIPPLRKGLSQLEPEDLGSVPEQLQDLVDHRNDEFPLRDVNVVVDDVISGLTVYREVDDLPSVAQHHATISSYNEWVIRRFIAVTAAMVALLVLLIHGPALSSLLVFAGGVGSMCWLLYDHRQGTTYRRIPVYVAGHSVRGTPNEVHSALMSVKDGRVLWDGANISVTVLERQDQHVDIVHMVQKPVFRWPFWYQPRDCVCLRYWAREADGSFVIVLQSTEHPAAPPRPDTVRADVLQWTFLICPMKPEYSERDHIVRQSYVIETVQYNPNHYLPAFKFLPQADAFLFVRPMMTNLLSLCEYMASRDFVDAVNRGRVAADISEIPPQTSIETIPAATEAESQNISNRQQEDVSFQSSTNNNSPNVGIRTRGSMVSHQRNHSFHTAPQYPVAEDGTVHGISLLPSTATIGEWKEPYCCKFRVRGPDYLESRVKVSAEPAIFHLVSVDKFSFEDPRDQTNIGPRSPKCRFPATLSGREREKQFTLVVCITPPSSKNITVVLYFRPLDPYWRHRNPRFTNLFDQFVSSDDNFRNSRFKLLPDIVKGPFVLRSALRSRPAIPGKKVPILYHRGDNWFEIDIDVSTAGKAKFITALALPIAKSIVVDLGFVIEGQDPSELPEQIIGAIRFNKMDLSVLTRIPKGGSLDEFGKSATSLTSGAQGRKKNK